MKKLIGFILLLSLTASGQQLVRPGAGGFGKYTNGGRGGRLIEVSNTNNSGAGSFRAAVVDSQGARVAWITTGGDVSLLSTVRPRDINDNDSLTIVGEWAPGDGFALNGDDLEINASEVVVTGIRIRASAGHTVGGSHSTPTTRDAIFIENTVDHIYIANNDIMWGSDMAIGIFNSGAFPGADFVTIEWNFIGETFQNYVHNNGEHAKTININGGRRISVLNNYFHHIGNDRAPNFVGNSSGGAISMYEYVGNLHYNWGTGAGKWKPATGGGGNAVGYVIYTDNVYVTGPDSLSPTPYPAFVIDSVNIEAKGEPVGIYVRGNINSHTRPTNTGSPWTLFVVGPRDYQNVSFQSTAVPFESFGGFRVNNVDGDMRRRILANAGAIAQGGDAIHRRWQNEFETRSGNIPNGETVGTVYYPFGTVASAPNADTVIINTVENVLDDRYNGFVFETTGGTGHPQSKTITFTDDPSQNGTVKLGFGSNFSPPLDGTTTYRIAVVISAPVAGAAPTLAAGTYPTDTDGDLMPDWAEVAIGSNPAVADATGDVDGDGWLNWEEIRDLKYSGQYSSLRNAIGP